MADPLQRERNSKSMADKLAGEIVAASKERAAHSKKKTHTVWLKPARHSPFPDLTIFLFFSPGWPGSFLLQISGMFLHDMDLTRYIRRNRNRTQMPLSNICTSRLLCGI
jgi:hypothetical protein